MEFAITARKADNSYQNICWENSIVLDFLAISAGAIVGANLRYWMSRYAVRVLGRFVLGFFLIWTTERTIVDPRWRLLIAVGFCGGFTTFSSYAYESMAFLQQGQWSLLAVNFFSNNVLACVAALAGMALARVL